MMFSIYFIAFIIFYALACSVEFIVFNEEILLAICFFTFVFFSYNTFSDSIYNSLKSRATKFESDFLISFASKREASVSNFQKLFFTNGFQSKFQILLSSILAYLTFTQYSLLLSKISTIQSSSLSKLTELMLINNRLISVFHKACIDQVLYPLIFKSKKNVLITNNIVFSTNSLTMKAQILKSFSA